MTIFQKCKKKSLDNSAALLYNMYCVWQERSTTMKKNKKKSNKFNLIICAIAFIVMVVYLLFVDKPENILNALRKINPLMLAAAVLLIGGYWLCESLTIHTIIKPLHPTAKFRHSWLDTIIGQYFNCITPCASGGQPMQAYYFVQFGIPLGVGLTALLSRFIVYQFVLTASSAFTLIAGYNQFGEDLSHKGLMPFVFIGFIINFGVMFFLIAIAFWKRPTEKVTNWVVTLMAKLKITKHPLKRRLYFIREINKFHKNFMFLKKNVPVILKACFFTVLQTVMQLSISYVLYLGFGLDTSNYLQIISYQAYSNMISSFIPLPGAMGAAELGYSGFFKDIFGGYTGVSTMLWRIITFYLPIIVGIAHMLSLRNMGYKEPTTEELEISISSDQDN